MKNINTLVRPLVVVSTLILFTACATIIKGTSQIVSINSNVRGATVIVNGETVGVTPYNGPIKRKQGTTVTLQKDGYDPKTFTMTTEVEAVFWGNVIFGGPFGSTTDLTTGAMYYYAPATLQIDLQRTEEEETPQAKKSGSRKRSGD